MLTDDELDAIRSRLTVLRERLAHYDEAVLVEVQWLQVAANDIARLLEEVQGVAASSFGK